MEATLDAEEGVVAEHAATLRWLEAYQPTFIEPAEWEPLRAFVVGAVATLNKPLDRTKRYTLVLAKITAWCVRQGTPLNLELVLDPETVEHFCRHGLPRGPSAATYRADLRWLGRRLTRKAPWEPPPEALAHRQVAQPYTLSEIRRLEQLVQHQTTAQRCRIAEAIFVMGLGAGLDGRGMAHVRGQHVITTTQGFTLIRLPDRLAVCRDRFAGRLLKLAEVADDELLIGGESEHRNRFSRLQDSLSADSRGLRLTARRLRATWLVHHLEAGTRLPELVQASGLATVAVLSDLLPEVGPLTTDRALAERKAWAMLAAV